MSFDLRIRFVGLAMFVPEEAREEDGVVTQPARMHVLLPAGEPDRPHDDKDAGSVEPAAADAEQDGYASVAGNGSAHPQPRGGNGRHDRHFARIAYDTAYETGGSADLSRTLRLVSLEKRSLELLGLSDEGLYPGLPGEICQLSEVAGGLPPEVVGPVPGRGLLGRVTMDAGVLSDVGLGAFFKLSNREPERMTTRTEWTIRGIEGDRLPGQVLGSLNGEPGDELPDLFPVRQTIHLVVFNAPRSEFPPFGEFRVDQPARAADHFELYYNLYRRVPGEVPQSAASDEIRPIKVVPRDARAKLPDDPGTPPHGVHVSDPEEIHAGSGVPADSVDVPVSDILTSATMTCVNAQGTLVRT